MGDQQTSDTNTHAARTRTGTHEAPWVPSEKPARDPSPMIPPGSLGVAVCSPAVGAVTSGLRPAVIAPTGLGGESSHRDGYKDTWRTPTPRLLAWTNTQHARSSAWPTAFAGSGGRPWDLVLTSPGAAAVVLGQAGLRGQAKWCRGGHCSWVVGEGQHQCDFLVAELSVVGTGGATLRRHPEASIDGEPDGAPIFGAETA
jgi:hypothetical protein